jgi:hypothetical protein
MWGQPSSLRLVFIVQKTETKAILSLSGSVYVSADGAGGGGCQAVIVYYVELVSSVYTVQL